MKPRIIIFMFNFYLIKKSYGEINIGQTNLWKCINDLTTKRLSPIPFIGSLNSP